jgi:hypothetical protein
MRYNEIRATLEDHLSTLPSAPPIIPENVRVVTDEGLTYLQTSMVPIRTRIRTLRGDGVQQRYQGWFQIRVLTPRFVGTGDALEIVDAIADHFEVGKSIQTPDGRHLTIEYAEVGNKSLQDTHFSTILNVGWYLYAS